MKSSKPQSQAEYRRTKNGLIARMYSGMRTHSVQRGHAHPEFTLYELREWVYSQHNFQALYDNWVASGYKTMMVPSCDRTDDYMGYSLNRLTLTTWRNNYRKGCEDRRNGVNNKTSKPVVQLTIEGLIVNEYSSISLASRKAGIYVGHISKCCNQKRETAGNFVWAFAS